MPLEHLVYLWSSEASNAQPPSCTLRQWQQQFRSACHGYWRWSPRSSNLKLINARQFRIRPVEHEPKMATAQLTGPVRNNFYAICRVLFFVHLDLARFVSSHPGLGEEKSFAGAHVIMLDSSRMIDRVLNGVVIFIRLTCLKLPTTQKR